MKDKAGVERPWLYRGIRVTEVFGLLTFFYGLASSEWLIAAAGVGIIVASYYMFCSRFPVVIEPSDSSIGMSDSGD